MGFPPARRLANLARLSIAALGSALWLACAHAGAPNGRRGEQVLDRGGELADVDAERATLTVTATGVTVWGLTEVPDGARLQVAYAGVDAITRAELLKSIQVRVAGVVTGVESTDPTGRSVEVETIEAVDGLLSHAGPLVHGWVRVRRGGEVVIRIWARLEVPRSALETTVRSVLAQRGAAAAAADPANIVGGLSP